MEAVQRLGANDLQPSANSIDRANHAKDHVDSGAEPT